MGSLSTHPNEERSHLHVVPVPEELPLQAFDALRRIKRLKGSELRGRSGPNDGSQRLEITEKE